MISMTADIWGRSFELGVRFEQFVGEDILPIQGEAFARMLNRMSMFEEAKPEVERYCVERDEGDIETPIENIFKYVVPDSLFIARTESFRTVALMCDYRFDIEHGIAIVFENESFVRVGPQDIVL